MKFQKYFHSNFQCFFIIFVGIIDAALDDVFASVCSNHKAYTNEKKKSLGKNDFTHIPHGHNGKNKTLRKICIDFT